MNKGFEENEIAEVGVGYIIHWQYDLQMERKLTIQLRDNKVDQKAILAAYGSSENKTVEIKEKFILATENTKWTIYIII